MGLGEDDIKLQVGIDGVTSTKSELGGLTKAVNETKDAGKSIPINADASGVREATTDVGDLTSSLNDVATVASIPRENIKVLRVAIKAASSDLDSIFISVGKFLGLLSSPVVLAFAAAIGVVKLALAGMAEQQEKVARAQARSNDEAERSKKILDDLGTAEEKRVRTLAEIEAKLAEGGQQPTQAETEKVGAAVAEAAKRTGADKKTLIDLVGTGARTADELVRASGLPELDPGSFRGQAAAIDSQGFSDSIDTTKERETAREQLKKRIKAGIYADEQEIQSLEGFALPEVISPTARANAEQRKLLKDRIDERYFQLANLDDEGTKKQNGGDTYNYQNAIILGGRDTRKALPDSHVPVP